MSSEFSRRQIALLAAGFAASSSRFTGTASARRASAASEAASAASATRFAKGVSLFPWFGFSRAKPMPSRDYAWPAFQIGRTIPTARDLARLRASGFDFVRIPLDPGPFVALPASERAQLFAQLERAMAQVRATGLAIVVNPQASAGGSHWSASRFLAQGDDGAFDAYRAVTVEFARLAQKIAPESAALELFNEPLTACDFDLLAGPARAIAPRRPCGRAAIEGYPHRRLRRHGLGARGPRPDLSGRSARAL